GARRVAEGRGGGGGARGRLVELVRRGAAPDAAEVAVRGDDAGDQRQEEVTGLTHVTPLSSRPRPWRGRSCTCSCCRRCWPRCRGPRPPARRFGRASSPRRPPTPTAGPSSPPRPP